MGSAGKPVTDGSSIISDLMYLFRCILSDTSEEMYLVEMRTVDLIWLGERLAQTGRLDMRAQQPGVPAIEFVVMRHLVDGPPSTITSLVSRTGYAQSRVSTAVASLVERGWAQTESDPSD